MVKDYLARQLAARINELIVATACQNLVIDCSTSRLVKVKIFTDPLVLEKLEPYGISYIHRGKSDEYAVNFYAKHLKYNNQIEVGSGRIINSLCPNSRKHYDLTYTKFYENKDA